MRSNFSPPAIVKAVKFSMKIADDALTNHVLYSDYLAAKNIGDKVGRCDFKPGKINKNHFSEFVGVHHHTNPHLSGALRDWMSIFHEE